MMMNKPKFEKGDHVTEPKYDISNAEDAIAIANRLEQLHVDITSYIDDVGLIRTLGAVANAVIPYDSELAKKLIDVIYESTKND